MHTYAEFYLLTIRIRMKIIIVGITMAVKGKEEKGILLWLKRDVFTTSNEQTKMLEISSFFVILIRFGELARNWRLEEFNEISKVSCPTHDLCQNNLCLWTKVYTIILTNCKLPHKPEMQATIFYYLNT